MFQAWQAFKASGRILTYEEISQHDPRWVSDVLLMDQLYRWVNNDSIIMATFKATGGKPGETGYFVPGIGKDK